MLRAISSASPMTRLALMPGAGSSSYMVTTGPVRTATISPFTLKSASTVSSSRALRSSASLSSLGVVVSGAAGSVSRSSEGRLYCANMSLWRALGMTACFGGALGSGMSGARRGVSITTGVSAPAFSARFVLRGSTTASASFGSAISRAVPVPRHCASRAAAKRGRVTSCAQSITKTRVVSATAAPSASSASASVVQPSNPSPNALASCPSIACTPPAPSRPVSPPIEAGSDPPGLVKARLATVANNVIASSRTSTGDHQRVSVSRSSSSTSRHSLRAAT